MAAAATAVRTSMRERKAVEALVVGTEVESKHEVIVPQVRVLRRRPRHQLCSLAALATATTSRHVAPLPVRLAYARTAPLSQRHSHFAGTRAR